MFFFKFERFWSKFPRKSNRRHLKHMGNKAGMAYGFQKCVNYSPPRRNKKKHALSVLCHSQIRYIRIEFLLPKRDSSKCFAKRLLFPLYHTALGCNMHKVWKNFAIGNAHEDAKLNILFSQKHTDGPKDQRGNFFGFLYNSLNHKTLAEDNMLSFFPARVLGGTRKQHHIQGRIGNVYSQRKTSGSGFHTNIMAPAQPTT